MKYSNEVLIDLPRNKVIELLDDPGNMKHWQEGLLEYEPITETQGESGSKMKLKYKMRGKDIEMIETVVEKDLPHIYKLTYDTKGVHNIQINKFEQLDENRTKWISESEFRFDGLSMKLMGFVMPGAFKKQSQKYLDKFKEFAESKG